MLRRYICFYGDCNQIPLLLDTQSVFVAQDALGRDYYCVDSGVPEIAERLSQDSFKAMLEAQRSAHKQGFSKEGTRLLEIECEDEEALRRLLIGGTFPPREECERRLKELGWTLKRLSEPIGSSPGPVELTITNGEEDLTVEGETINEVWYRAVQRVVGPLPQIEGKWTMMLSTESIHVPLKAREDGVYRVGDSRVSFDVVIGEYHKGADPESIAHAYPTLQLADIYAVIAYYLQNRTEVDRYLRLRQKEADRLRQEIEASQPNKDEFRARLLARQAKQEGTVASPSK
jgi:uncharacterized protein (DUF433 family)